MYPCDCPDVKWLVDNYKLFIKDNDTWVISWMEIDKESKPNMIIQTFGIKFNFCMFCGKKIKGRDKNL